VHRFRRAAPDYCHCGALRLQCDRKVLKSNLPVRAGLHQRRGPLRQWGWAFAITTATWANGNGSVPNAADYALIEAGDTAISGAVRRLGDVVGWFGWRTLALAGEHSHILGLPVNLDNGQLLQQTAAQAHRNTNSNTVEFGSPMTGGSSGGPYVLDFGVGAAGQSPTVLNQVTGVMSYGYNGSREVGASILDSRWIGIWNTACAHRAGNCN